jgi:hypothetical protein
MNASLELAKARADVVTIREMIDSALDRSADRRTLLTYAALLKHKKWRLAQLEALEEAAEVNRVTFRL